MARYRSGGDDAVKSPTRYMLILGRTYADGTEQDYEAVNALQDQLSLRPLSQFGKHDWTFTPPPVNPNPGFSMTDKPQDVILKLGTKGYFDMMGRLMCKDAPPAPEDAPIIAKMATIGVVPCKEFDLAKFDPATRDALNKLPQEALDTIAAVAITETKKNKMFTLPGLGKLVLRDTKARMGRNPATGEAIKIKASKKVAFRAAKELKESI